MPSRYTKLNLDALMPDPAVVGQRIRALRMKRGWTLVELSRRSGVNLSIIGLTETGKRKATVRTLIGLGIALHRSIEFLLFGVPRRGFLVRLCKNARPSRHGERVGGI